jgi:DNA modification methylase
MVTKAKLIDNVQFIYELALAQMELRAFNVEFNILNNLREFELTNLDSEKENLLIKRLAYFENINGKVTDYYKIIKHNITKSINQYLTHWIYPYKGKFHPQMIRALLNIIGLNEGDTVLDPFVGSGTTAVEAQLLGINCIGIDISPLCVLQSKVKVESIFVLDKIKSLRDDAIRAFSSNSGGLSVFLEESTDYNGFLESIEDERVRNFFLIAKLIALSDQVRRNRKMVDSFIKNLDMMIKSTELYAKVVRELDLKLGMVKIMRCDARELPLEDDSVDGIITSPPYSIALDYVKNDAHALKALGYDLDKIREEFIGVRGTGSRRIELYNRDMIKCLNEMHRVLKPDRFCVIVIGNATYQGREIKTVEFIIDYCQRIGFKLVKNIDKIIYGLYNVMQKENILIFRKVE